MMSSVEEGVRATKISVLIVVLCVAAQLTLWIYSTSRPSLSDWLTASFALITVIYPLVFAFHAKQIKNQLNR